MNSIGLPVSPFTLPRCGPRFDSQARRLNPQLLPILHRAYSSLPGKTRRSASWKSRKRKEPAVGERIGGPSRNRPWLAKRSEAEGLEIISLRAGRLSGKAETQVTHPRANSYSFNERLSTVIRDWPLDLMTYHDRCHYRRQSKLFSPCYVTSTNANSFSDFRDTASGSFDVFPKRGESE